MKPRGSRRRAARAGALSRLLAAPAAGVGRRPRCPSRGAAARWRSLAALAAVAGLAAGGSPAVPAGAEGGGGGTAGDERPAGAARRDLRAGGERARGASRSDLLPGGDFERGAGGRPHGWQRPDGLTSFWERLPGGSGRGIRIDTDILLSQYLERQGELERAEREGRKPGPPPRRRPTRPPRYDTVAGNDGVHFVSERAPIDPRRFYKLQADVRSSVQSSPKVWVKAYGAVRSRGGTRERVLWKKALVCQDAGPEWATYTMVFPRSTRLPPAATHLRVQLFAYWPPATYWFDNVRLLEIDETEARAHDPESDRRSRLPARARRGGGE